MVRHADPHPFAGTLALCIFPLYLPSVSVSGTSSGAIKKMKKMVPIPHPFAGTPALCIFPRRTSGTNQQNRSGLHLDKHIDC